ncbi:hypothetical protein HKI87_01g01600 [Chloropicon roscoffensis]|uniref:Uncharacterized protein n=1 Tax=Chloropicon roscoffensis TaxID=1461544 RepID=A0AAX4NYV6_9CHLO
MPITSSSQRCVWRAAGAGAAPQRRSLRARCAAHKGGERPLAPSSSSEAGVATSTRRLALSLLGVAGLGAALPATALGPENVDLEIVDYQTVECAEGVPKGARCVQFKAIGNNKSKKAAYNGEIFGKVRYAGSNESAIYGDFAEATDAGKIGDIDEIPAGKNELTFTLLLQPGKEDDKLEFVNPKIRVYPGMSKNFRIMKPVSDTMDVCDPDYDLCD